MARSSAWAVGSASSTMRLAARARTRPLPSRITAPTGTSPRPPASSASASAEAMGPGWVRGRAVSAAMAGPWRPPGKASRERGQARQEQGRRRGAPRLVVEIGGRDEADEALDAMGDGLAAEHQDAEGEADREADHQLGGEGRLAAAPGDGALEEASAGRLGAAQRPVGKGAEQGRSQGAPEEATRPPAAAETQ